MMALMAGIDESKCNTAKHILNVIIISFESNGKQYLKPKNVLSKIPSRWL
jgi:hypothetical protein